MSIMGIMEFKEITFLLNKERIMMLTEPDLDQIGTYGSLARDLSSRDRGVVERMLREWSNEKIAGDLKISKKTVEKVFDRLFKRFKVNTRTALALRLPQYWPASKAGESPLRARFSSLVGARNERNGSAVVLTRAEEIIVRGVATGKTNREIADFYRRRGLDGSGRSLKGAKLKTTERDIQNRLSKVYEKLRKLGVHNRVGLVLWYVQHSLWERCLMEFLLSDNPVNTSRKNIRSGFQEGPDNTRAIGLPTYFGCRFLTLVWFRN
jgi:DNA-binding NarL/FixJ family response regulator